jgi:cell division protein FtsB
MTDVWPIKRAEFQKRYDDITAKGTQLNQDIDTLNNSARNYIQSGGVSLNPANDQNYIQSIEAAKRIAGYKNSLATLVREVNQHIKDISVSSDIGTKLAENGRLQQEIMDLEKEAKDYEDDAKTSELRESLLRSKESDITRHQVVFLGRPLRQSTIPFLWALSVLFIGASILMFQTMTPPLQPLFVTLFGSPSANGIAEGGGFLSDVRVWRTLVGAFTIVIIFLSLRVANVI